MLSFWYDQLIRRGDHAGRATQICYSQVAKAMQNPRMNAGVPQSPQPQTQLQVLESQRAALRVQLNSVGGERIPPDAIIQCANGHKYRFGCFMYNDGIIVTTEVQQVTNQVQTSQRDFMEMWPKSHTSGTVQQAVPVTKSSTSHAFGCPTCHTSVYSIDDPKFPGYQCCDQGHFFGPTYQICPVCELQEQIGTLETQMRALAPRGANGTFPVYYPPSKSPMPKWLSNVLNLLFMAVVITVVVYAFNSCGRH